MPASGNASLYTDEKHDTGTQINITETLIVITPEMTLNPEITTHILHLRITNNENSRDISMVNPAGVLQQVKRPNIHLYSLV